MFLDVERRVCWFEVCFKMNGTFLVVELLVMDLTDIENLVCIMRRVDTFLVCHGHLLLKTIVLHALSNLLNLE